MYTQSDLWDIIEAQLKEKGLVRQHLDSFNEFVDKGLQQIINEIGIIEPEIVKRGGSSEEGTFYIRLGSIKVGKPRIREADGSFNYAYPSEARLRNLTYAAPMHLEMTLVHKTEKKNPNHCILTTGWDYR